MENSKHNHTAIVLTITALLFFAAVIGFIWVKKVPMNDNSVIGNTAGNLYNKGLFCENDGIVYFSNAYDNGYLYSMNPDGSSVKRLSQNAVQHVNAGGKYLYYYQTGSSGSSVFGSKVRFTGIYRSLKNGKKATCLKRTPAAVVNLLGNYVYYQYFNNKTGMALYKTKIDKSKHIVVADYNINPASAMNGYIYYNDNISDYFLRTLSIESDSANSASVLLQEKVYNPIAQGEYIYYMSINDNYKLYRYSPSDGQTAKLTEDRIDTYNVYGDYIYYQKSDEAVPALKRMRIDGSEAEVVQEGVFSDINITSAYVYFHSFHAATPIYKTPVFGPVSVTTFDEAALAVPIK